MLYVVQKGRFKRLRVLAKSMSAGAFFSKLEATTSTTKQQVQSPKGQIAVLKAMTKACAAADDAAFFNALARSWSMKNNYPDQPTRVPRTLLASS